MLRTSQNCFAAVGAHSICARATVGSAAGGYGIRPYDFVFDPQGKNATFFIIYYLLSLI